MEIKNKIINFLGDSITEGSGTSGIGYRFTELIEKKCGAVCDFFKTTKFRPASCGVREKYMPDGLHINDAGHEIIADEIAELLLSL